VAENLHNYSMTTRVVQDEAEWDALRTEWEALFEASPTASTPLDFMWLRSWWSVYGPTYGAGGLRVFTFWRGTQLVGALPLYMSVGPGGPLGVRALRFISTGESQYEETCPDYLNLLCLPGEEANCTESVWGELGCTAWDYLEFLDLPADSPLLHDPEAKLVQRGSCPVAELGQGFDTYLTRLSAKTRQHARQYLRAADRSGAVLELATETDTDLFFDDLVRLHQERWTAEGKPGCFAAPRFAEFHRGLARAWVPVGRAVLARLSHEGQVYAVLYGFITGSKFDFYQSGITRTDSHALVSPGTTANLLLMRALTVRGVAEYDFLRGSSSYKERLATRSNPLAGIRIWRPTFRSAVHHSIRLVGRVVRKGRRLARLR
jgi:CelD/BcsL family acetyltransferase involved in cellulose biosynthesis